MDVHLRRSVVGPTQVLDVTGELDLSTIPRLHQELVALVADAAGENVVVDLDGVVSVDDAALGVLLGAAGRARQAGGDLTLVCSDPRLLARFAITRMDRAVVIRSSVNEIDG